MTALQEIQDTLQQADNEATASPYWLILDPSQNMSCDLYNLASQISGIFFSRQDAQDYLEARRHAFSSRARVFCHSGHHSRKYTNLCKELKI
ncbi:MAG: hypothetical protein DRQ78_10885 [Epsilonproteobacteria bacterium]|nr:MAG: hypothetical protein DRQ78_10885 [Campylobacterota bacterium]